MRTLQCFKEHPQKLLRKTQIHFFPYCQLSPNGPNRRNSCSKLWPRPTVYRTGPEPKSFGLSKKKSSLWVSLVRVLCYVFVDCLLCCKVIHVFDPNRPVQVFGQNCMLSSWRLLGEHQQNRAFFCQNWSYFPILCLKRSYIFRKNVKIL